jgi:hypothetical protein
MKLQNDTDEAITLNPGESIAVDAEKVEKHGKKLVALHITNEH